MIDTVTLRVVELARGGPGAEQLLVTSDSRLLIANANQVGVVDLAADCAVGRENESGRE